MCSEVTAKEVGGKQLPRPRAAGPGPGCAGWVSRRLIFFLWDKVKRQTTESRLEMLPMPTDGEYVSPC